MTHVPTLTRLLFVLATILPLAACEGMDETAVKPHAHAGQDVRTFDVRGRLLEIRDEGREVVIDHEEMPGYMAAMTMPFRMKEPLAPGAIPVDQEVTFRFVVSGAASYIEWIRPLADTEERPLVLAEEPERTAATDASLYQFDAEWTNQYGDVVQLGALSGRPVVLSMVFTNCSYACPMIVSDMKKIAASLPEAQQDGVQYVLVSLDPERDTPEVLRHFGEAYGLNTAGWTLLRGDAGQVRMLAALLGIRYRQQSDGQFAHTSLITLLNQDGEIAHQQQGLGSGNQLAVVLSDLTGSSTAR